MPIPIMILNGRRIEERTQIAQEGGSDWLAAHLRLSGFDPVVIDGRDPAAIAWSILDAEARLTRFAADPSLRYPAPLPYVIAQTSKGFGFPGAGTNAAHNLPLDANPRTDEAARQAFNRAARDLFVPALELGEALEVMATHKTQDRPRESGHPAAARRLATPAFPSPDWIDIDAGPSCAMDSMDRWFVDFIDANPALRPRVGNPDELRSNHMGRTLERLRHRVNVPEPGVPEAVAGGVITALNEEAVAGAALGNKGGLNLIVSYEAFAVKMLGGLRQEIIFARHQREVGQAPGWIAVPLIVTSHTWENAKNEQSHQDPTLGEALLGEMSDTARVLFPIDANSAVATLANVYRGHGQIACLIAPKRAMPHRLTGEQAQRLVEEGAAHLAGEPKTAAIQFVAIGAYQAEQALRAADRLESRGRRACVTVLLEPARFRSPRDGLETGATVDDATLARLFPPSLPRVILSHTRPEPMLGLLRRLDEGPRSMTALGYISRGGTLDVHGMLFANRCTWAHAVEAATRLCGWPREELLTADETAALDERGEPACLFPTET